MFSLLFFVSEVCSLILNLFLLSIVKGHHVPHGDIWILFWSTYSLSGQSLAHLKLVVDSLASSGHSVAHSHTFGKRIVFHEEALAKRGTFISFWSH